MRQTLTPNSFVQALPETYTSEATQGPLLCDIAYPLDAPGYAHDPTANPADVSLAATLWHEGPNQAARQHRWFCMPMLICPDVNDGSALCVMWCGLEYGEVAIAV